jgi:hypothetical protein
VLSLERGRRSCGSAEDGGRELIGPDVTSRKAVLLCVELLNKALTGMTLLWTLVVALAVAMARSALRIRSAFTALGSRLARALRWPRSRAQGVLFLRTVSVLSRVARGNDREHYKTPALKPNFLR